MNTTLQAAVHLRKKKAKNYFWDSLEQLFEEIKRLTCELSEILGPITPEIVGVKIIECEDTSSTSLLCGRIYQVTPLPKFMSSPTQHFVWAR